MADLGNWARMCWPHLGMEKRRVEVDEEEECNGGRRAETAAVLGEADVEMGSAG